MRQKVGKKQSKHSNARIKSKRTRRGRTVKKRRVSVKGGGDFPYNAIVFDVDQTILPKLCGRLDFFFGKNGEFIEKVEDDDTSTTTENKIERVKDVIIGKKKIISKQNFPEQKQTFTLLNIKETEILIQLLTELKKFGIKLFLATRCQPEKHIDHPFLNSKKPKDETQQQLYKNLKKLRSLFLNANQDLSMFGADSEYLLINPNTEETSQLSEETKKEPFRKQEWAKYKAYFLQQLKEKLGSDAKILFVDDDDTNTKMANEAGFDTLTTNKDYRKISEKSIEWTIRGLQDIFKSFIKQEGHSPKVVNLDDTNIKAQIKNKVQNITDS